MKLKSSSPWGTVDYVKEVFPGIFNVGTSSHGGYKLDRKRNAQVHPAWRIKGGWYEEDCNWAIVAYTFRAEFGEAVFNAAVSSLKSWTPDNYTLVSGNPVSLQESHVLRERAAKQAAAGKLQVLAAWGDWHQMVPTGMVGVVARVDGREGRGAERYYLVPAEEYEKRGSVFVVDPERHQEIGMII